MWWAKQSQGLNPTGGILTPQNSMKEGDKDASGDSDACRGTRLEKQMAW